VTCSGSGSYRRDGGIVAVTIEGEKRLKRNIDELYKRLESKAMKRRIGRMVVDMVYKRVKAGGGVDGLGKPPESTSRVKLAPLTSAAYLNRRMGSTLGPFGAAKRSNLTNTGQMLESLGFKVIAGVVLVNVANTARFDSDLTDREVSAHVSKDRPWLALTKSEYRILLKEIDRIVFIEIKRIFI